MSQKRIILSDSSLNRYGYRVLTEGLDIEAFKKNPIMLYMHFHDEGTPNWCDYKAIGYWDDIQINGDELSAIPVFDKADDLSKMIAAKYEAGTYRSASIGFIRLATSSEKEYLLPGQTRETVTRSEVLEASIVDVPGNANAVRLYNRTPSVNLAAGKENCFMPELPNLLTPEQKMNFKPTWLSFFSMFNIDKDKAESTELSADNIEQIHSEMTRLKTENDTLVQAKTDVDGKLATATTEISTLKTDIQNKDTEISTLKSEAATSATKIAELEQQVQNLKNNPTPGGGAPAPKGEIIDEGGKNELAAYLDKEPENYQGITEKLKAEGLI